MNNNIKTLFNNYFLTNAIPVHECLHVSCGGMSVVMDTPAMYVRHAYVMQYMNRRDQSYYTLKWHFYPKQKSYILYIYITQ